MNHRTTRKFLQVSSLGLVEMMRAIFSLGLISFWLGESGHSASLAISEEAMIGYAKSLLVSSFDPRLPRIPLEYFLAYETDAAPAKWAVTKCADQYLSTPVSSQSTPIICVTAAYELKHRSSLTVFIELHEVLSAQPSGKVVVKLADVKGKVREIHSLVDLPMELHRRSLRGPLRTPRDLPLPGLDS
jgi:hypothetical protein